MAKEFKEKQMRSELICLYEEFLKNPESEEVQSKLINFDRDFGGLAGYNDYLKSRPIPKDIELALGAIADLGLYGQGFKEKEECISFAKETISLLKSKQE